MHSENRKYIDTENVSTGGSSLDGHSFPLSFSFEVLDIVKCTVMVPSCIVSQRMTDMFLLSAIRMQHALEIPWTFKYTCIRKHILQQVRKMRNKFFMIRIISLLNHKITYMLFFPLANCNALWFNFWNFDLLIY